MKQCNTASAAAATGSTSEGIQRLAAVADCNTLQRVEGPGEAQPQRRQGRHNLQGDDTEPVVGLRPSSSLVRRSTALLERALDRIHWSLVQYTSWGAQEQGSLAAARVAAVPAVAAHTTTSCSRCQTELDFLPD